jgi:hypothetical protein
MGDGDVGAGLGIGDDESEVRVCERVRLGESE